MWDKIPDHFRLSGKFSATHRESAELTSSVSVYENGAVTRVEYLRDLRPFNICIKNRSILTMAEEPPQRDLAGSSATFPTDSENYSSSHNELSPSPPSSSHSPMILYSPPTIWGLLRGAAINILLPFVNGLMLGFGELLAHEAAFRLGWSGTKVCWQ